jgi:hypothetical protein
MKRHELDERVSAELEHIPKADDGSDQNALRMAYNMIRRRELTRNPAAPEKDSLELAVRAVREGNPGFLPHYDESYFAPDGRDTP